jgi:transcriptional regulator with XRE-family HTH domain
MNVETPHIADRIKALMQRRKITDAELARQINVPQATISRILSGVTKDPRVSTLREIARVLGSTIDHLVNDTGHAIPVLEWHEIKSFAELGVDELLQRDWISATKPIVKGSFAVKTTPSMEPRYRSGSTLIVEPTEVYRDFQVAIVSLDGDEPTIRRVIKDGSSIFLKKLADTMDMSPIPVSITTKIIGVVTEARMAE